MLPANKETAHAGFVKALEAIGLELPPPRKDTGYSAISNVSDSQLAALRRDYDIGHVITTGYSGFYRVYVKKADADAIFILGGLTHTLNGCTLHVYTPEEVKTIYGFDWRC